MSHLARIDMHGTSFTTQATDTTLGGEVVGSQHPARILFTQEVRRTISSLRVSRYNSSYPGTRISIGNRFALHPLQHNFNTIKLAPRWSSGGVSGCLPPI